MWLAAGLLGTLIFAALVLALQEPYPKAANQLKEELQASGDALVNANPKAVGLNPENPPPENRPPPMEAPESTKTTVPRTGS